MYFLINELSIVGQFSSLYEATEYLDIIRLILQEIKHLDLKLLTHQSLADRKLTPNYTVRDWLQYYCSTPHKDIDFLRLIISLFKGSCISTLLDREVKNDLHYWECYFNDLDLSYSSLAGAAYFDGRLISVQRSESFDIPILNVRFKQNTDEFYVFNVPNLYELNHARELRPKYKYHPKHDLIGHWDNATPMDLNDNEAQEALDQSIPHEGHTQRYSFYRQNFYIFQNDNAGGYHGYPINENKVPNDILKVLKNRI
jgi:hypothetical protein